MALFLPKQDAKEMSIGSGRPGLPVETLAVSSTQQHKVAPGARVVNSKGGPWSLKLPKIQGECKRLQRG